MDKKRLNSREFPGFCQRRGGGGDGNRSSVSSEGFCENDADMANLPPFLGPPQVVLVRHGYGEFANCGDTDSQVCENENKPNSRFSLFYEF